MRYMLLIYKHENSHAGKTPQETQRDMDAVWAVMREARDKGVLQVAEPLGEINTAMTVRRQGSNPVITDGPFAETKEQLAGYYILDCKNMDEALQWAARIPTCGGPNGCIEVRPLRDIPISEQIPDAVLASAQTHG